MANLVSTFARQSGPTVRAATLEPVQRPTEPAFRNQCDFWQQRLLKHPRRSEFHSRAEYLHAGLLEGDRDVISFVPQPFVLQIGRRRYTPDCFVLSRSGRRVVEIKPGGELDSALWGPLSQYFGAQGMAFEVVANETIFERRQEAENWLEIVRRLVPVQDLDTATVETSVWRGFERATLRTVGDVIDVGDREATYTREIALYRLLHRGVLAAELNRSPLGYDTEVWACH